MAEKRASLTCRQERNHGQLCAGCPPAGGSCTRLHTPFSVWGTLLVEPLSTCLEVCTNSRILAPKMLDRPTKDKPHHQRTYTTTSCSAPILLLFHIHRNRNIAFCNPSPFSLLPWTGSAGTTMTHHLVRSTVYMCAEYHFPIITIKSCNKNKTKKTQNKNLRSYARERASEPGVPGPRGLGEGGGGGGRGGEGRARRRRRHTGSALRCIHRPSSASPRASPPQ